MNGADFEPGRGVVGMAHSEAVGLRTQLRHAVLIDDLGIRNSEVTFDVPAELGRAIGLGDSFVAAGLKDPTVGWKSWTRGFAKEVPQGEGGGEEDHGGGIVMLEAAF
jgi:hypothetical protein